MHKTFSTPAFHNIGSGGFFIRCKTKSPEEAGLFVFLANN